jgi:uncharacterized protein (TIGR02466 family)
MQLASLFSTPVAMHEPSNVKDMNREITAILLTESETIPSISNSNVGGWHSQYELQNRPEACFQTLSALIVASVLETTETIAQNTGRRIPKFTAKPEMWAMVMRDGDYTVPHTHAYAHWATVYYADEGDAADAANPNSGVITFVDPRSGHMPVPGLDIANGNFVVNPKAGQLLVFPGWLTHYVHTYRGQRPRVSLSCNVTLEVVKA